MDTKRHSAVFIAAAGTLLALPGAAYAAVYLNEVAWMGTDAGGSGCEWVELYNSSSAEVSLSGWTLAIANTGASTPKILALDDPASARSASIPGGGFYLIARDSGSCGTLPPGNAADWLGSFGNGISNAGSILTLVGGGKTVDSVDAHSGWASIGGENASGQPKEPAVRTASGWTTAAATPRASNPNNIPAEVPGAGAAGAATSTSAAQTPAPATGGGVVVPALEADAGGDRAVEAGAGSFFDGHIYDAEGVPLPRARYLWNFGNGETREGQSVFYAYPYPGTYVVVMTVDAGNGYSATDHIIVEAVPAEVGLSQESDGSVIIANLSHTGRDLDVGLWALARGGKAFIIPKGTIILPNRSVRFSPALLSAPLGEAALLYPDGIVAARALPWVEEPPEVSGASPAAPTPLPLSARSPESSYEARADIPPGQTSSNSASSTRPRPANLAAVAAASASLPFDLATVGLAAFLTLGAAGVVFARRGYAEPPGEGSEPEDPRAEADERADEYLIREKSPAAKRP